VRRFNVAVWTSILMKGRKVQRAMVILGKKPNILVIFLEKTKISPIILV